MPTSSFIDYSKIISIKTGSYFDLNKKDQNLHLISESRGFSSEILARYVFQARALDNYLVLRFVTSKLIEILYINDGILMLYGQYRISNGKIKSIKAIGSVEDKKKIKVFYKNPFHDKNRPGAEK